MAGAAIPDTAAVRDPVVGHLSDPGLPTEAESPDRTPPGRARRTGPVGPHPPHPIAAGPTDGEAVAPSDVVLHALWFQLPESDRQRFGSCFSGMILKALGHRR